MRQWLRSHLTYANVIATIALFLALGGGGLAVASHLVVQSSDIVDNQVFSADVRNDSLSGGGLAALDLRPGSVASSEVVNGSLNDEDIGHTTVVNFTGTIGTVPANSCVDRGVTGVNAQGDHLLLTRNYNTSSPNLIYSAEYLDGDEAMEIQVCNPTTFDINDGTTRFNLLVIDAQ
jgi:hypothetical protein